MCIERHLKEIRVSANDHFIMWRYNVLLCENVNPFIRFIINILSFSSPDVIYHIYSLS